MLLAMPGWGLGPQSFAAPHGQSRATRTAFAQFTASGLAERFHTPDLFRMVTLAVLYYGAAHLSYALEFAGPVASIVWLPVGVGVAFLYLGGLQLWPGVMLGDLAVNNYSALPVGSALGQTAGNVLEVYVAALLIRRLVRSSSPLASVGSLSRTLLAIGVGTVVSATVGTLSLRLGDVITTGAAPSVWRTWWLGDWSGALVVVPLAIAWSRASRSALRGRSWVEAVLAIAVVAGLSGLSVYSHRPLTYLVFPGLIWAALRFAQRGTTLAIAIVTGFAVLATTHFVGPFASHSLTRSVLMTQLYIGVSALTTLYLGAVVTEREELAERLRASRTRLVEAADTERRRLEHNIHDGAQQRLTALAVRLNIVSGRVREEPDAAAALIEGMGAELSLAIDELRELGHGIEPTQLTRFGLSAAIENIAERSAFPIEVLEVPSTRMDYGAEAAAYYVVAEAVTNAQKHARASSIRVRARVAHRMLQIEIVDDGLGGAAETGGFGLQGLRDRVEALDGKFEVDSSPGHGTRIAAAIPVTIVAA
jgi:signal transduction histidine kinase